MIEHPTVKWIGSSGKQYTYFVRELPVNFSADQNGNYIYSKLNQSNEWVPIYIGQGDMKEEMESHHNATCIKDNGATHVHVHKKVNEDARLNEKQDLLASYTNAYAPTGCNEREGG